MSMDNIIIDNNYSEELLDKVRNDPSPLVERLRGNYNGRVFQVSPISIVAAQRIEELEEEVAYLESLRDKDQDRKW